MIRRILLGTGLILVLITLIVLDANLSRAVPDQVGLALWFCWAGPTTLLFGILAAAAGLEMAALARQSGHRPVVAWAVLVIVGLVLIPWVTRHPGTPCGLAALGDWQISTIWLVIGVVGAAAALVLRAEPENAFGDFGTTCVMMLYVGVLAAFAVRLRTQLPGPMGAWMVLLWLCVVKSSDIGGYFFGLLLGRHKLAPALSPNKTIEGLLGGMLLAVGISVLFGRIGPILAGNGMAGRTWLTFPQALVFGTVMALVGHLGDLSESLLKRSAGAKDSARLLADFGGVLDLIDSPLLTAPVAWWLLTSWHPAG